MSQPDSHDTAPNIQEVIFRARSLLPISLSRQAAIGRKIERIGSKLETKLDNFLGLNGTADSRRLQMEFFIPKVSPTPWREAVKRSVQEELERLLWSTYSRQRILGVLPNERLVAKNLISRVARTIADRTAHLRFLGDYICEELKGRVRPDPTTEISSNQAQAVMAAAAIRIRLEMTLQRATIDPFKEVEPWISMGVAALRKEPRAARVRLCEVIGKRLVQGDPRPAEVVQRLVHTEHSTHRVVILIEEALNFLRKVGRVPTRTEIKNVIRDQPWPVSFPLHDDRKSWNRLFGYADLEWLPPGKSGRPSSVQRTRAKDFPKSS